MMATTSAAAESIRKVTTLSWSSGQQDPLQVVEDHPCLRIDHDLQLASVLSSVSISNSMIRTNSNTHALFIASGKLVFQLLKARTRHSQRTN